MYDTAGIDGGPPKPSRTDGMDAYRAAVKARAEWMAKRIARWASRSVMHGKRFMFIEPDGQRVAFVTTWGSVDQLNDIARRIAKRVDGSADSILASEVHASDSGGALCVIFDGLAFDVARLRDLVEGASIGRCDIAF